MVLFSSMIGEGDSIVGVLGMKDKMQMHREIDSLDIVNTVNVDTGIEQERNDASINTTELLITGQYHSFVISHSDVKILNPSIFIKLAHNRVIRQ